VVFVVFNYDRCLEQFLFFALQHYWHVDANEAYRPNEARSRSTIHTGVSVRFRQRRFARHRIRLRSRRFRTLAPVCARIATFTEQIGGTITVVSDIGRKIAEQTRVIFPGFSFQYDNMDL